MEDTQVRVNATTLDDLYRKANEIKRMSDDFTVGWLADGIVYGSHSGRMTLPAEATLVNMSTDDLLALILEASDAGRTMGDMARYVNEKFDR